MQDSNIVYTVKAVGVEEATAKFNQLGATIQKMKFNADGSVTASGKMSSAMNEQAKATDSAANATNRASKAQEGYFGHIAKTTVQSALINKLFLELVDVSGQAVKQVDLMNNFPATMKSMGQSVEDSNVALKALRDYVGQIGGNLGTATSFVTRFTGVTKDVKSAVAVFTGLNNALIAGDSSAEEQRLAMIQFAQALERGKPDMREWMSLTQNMSFQLGLVAKSMGYVNTNALGEALRNGEESMAAFTTTLTELSTGTGPIAKQALTRMQGTEFAFNVMKNTMVQGLAAIINAFNRTNIVSFFSFLTQVIQVLSQAVVTLIGWIFTLINAISRLFGGKDIAKLGTDAGVLAENLASAEDASGGIGDGLKGADKDAKKLQKSLAAFDKMNVLPDPTDSKDTSAGGTGSSFDPTQTAKLGDLFGDISGKLQEVSIWAKIFAGILGGLTALKIGQNFLNQLNGMAKTFEETSKNIGKMQESFKKMSDSFKTSMQTMKDSYEKAFLKGTEQGNKIKDVGAKIGNGFVSGLAGAVGGLATKIWPAIVAAFAPVAAAIGGVFAAGAAALGVSVGVFVAIVAAVVAVVVGLIWLIAKNWDTIWGWIKTAATVFWGWIVALWQTLYDVLSGPIRWLWQFMVAVFILIVAVVATFVETVVKIMAGIVLLIWNYVILPIIKLFVELFKAIVNIIITSITLIFTILKTIALWVWDNVITPVLNFFVWLWQSVANAVATAWSWIFDNVLSPIANWIYNNVIAPIFNFFKSLWDNISGFVGGFVTNIKNFLSPITSWIKTNIIDKIAGFFSGLWDGVKNGLSNMIDGLKNIFGGIGNVFKTPINGIIDLLNKALQSLNRNVKVPDWVPGLGGKGVNFPMIPQLATGGVVSQPTMAMIGEAGAEAVVPLENNTQWIDKLASKISTSPSQPQSSDIIPVTNRKEQPTNKIDIHVAGVFATSAQEQKRIADIIAKQVEQTLRAKGFKGAY